MNWCRISCTSANYKSHVKCMSNNLTVTGDIFLYLVLLFTFSLLYLVKFLMQDFFIYSGVFLQCDISTFT